MIYESLICLNCFVDGSSSSFEDAVLSRLAETGATQSSSAYSSSKHMEEETESPCEKTKNIEQNIEASIENLWYLKDGLHATLLNELRKDGMNKDTVDAYAIIFNCCHSLFLLVSCLVLYTYWLFC